MFFKLSFTACAALLLSAVPNYAISPKDLLNYDLHGVSRSTSKYSSDFTASFDLERSDEISIHLVRPFRIGKILSYSSSDAINAPGKVPASKFSRADGVSTDKNSDEGKIFYKLENSDSNGLLLIERKKLGSFSVALKKEMQLKEIVTSISNIGAAYSDAASFYKPYLKVAKGQYELGNVHETQKELRFIFKPKKNAKSDNQRNKILIEFGTDFLSALKDIPMEKDLEGSIVMGVYSYDS